MRRDSIEGLIQLTPPRFDDERGYVTETYNRRWLADLGIDATFVQENRSYSIQAGVVRGLHYQTPPRAQGKLVHVVCGSILDVAVDLRAGSPTYLDHVAVRLDGFGGTQLWIPAGFAHGFCTLEAGTVVAYKLTNYWSPELEARIRFDDPALGIDWPVSPGAAHLSPRDASAPLLTDLDIRRGSVGSS